MDHIAVLDGIRWCFSPEAWSSAYLKKLHSTCARNRALLSPNIQDECNLSYRANHSCSSRGYPKYTWLGFKSYHCLRTTGRRPVTLIGNRHWYELTSFPVI